MRLSVLALAVLFVLITVASPALAQCKWDCEEGTDPETNEQYVTCTEYVEGMHDYNTCEALKKCMPTAGGGERCTLNCEVEWCYFV